MGGDRSQKLRPWRGIISSPGRSTPPAHIKINTLTEKRPDGIARGSRLFSYSQTGASNQLQTAWVIFGKHRWVTSRKHRSRERASAPGAVFTLDGGDTFQGSAVAAWTQGEAVVAPLNALGIDAGTPGNWEVVYGPEVFRKLMSEVNYKVICYNFSDKNTGKRLFAPAVILEKNGVRVAFVGITDPTTTMRQSPAQVAGLDSTQMGGFRETVQGIQRTEKPDLIVLIDHTGLARSVQLAHDIPEFDIILSGHTHERVYKPIMVGKTIVVEPGSMGSFIGQLDVTLSGGKISDCSYQLLGVDETRFAENQKVKALIENAERPFQAQLHEVVGATNTTLMRYDVLETTMDNFVDDAVREATHTEVAFTNGFRFSPPLAAGPITEADIWNMIPFDVKLKAGRVSGTQMRAYLENEMESGLLERPSEALRRMGHPAVGNDDSVHRGSAQW